MCQSESPNEAGNTWLVGWMISTGWYLKTRKNQESSQQKTHTLLPSMRKSFHNWHIYCLFWRHPSCLETFSFLMRSPVSIESLNILKIVTNHSCLHARQHNFGCASCRLAACGVLSPTVVAVWSLDDIYSWCIQALLQSLCPFNICAIRNADHLRRDPKCIYFHLIYFSTL